VCVCVRRWRSDSALHGLIRSCLMTDATRWMSWVKWHIRYAPTTQSFHATWSTCWRHRRVFTCKTIATHYRNTLSCVSVFTCKTISSSSCLSAIKSYSTATSCEFANICRVHISTHIEREREVRGDGGDGRWRGGRMEVWIWIAGDWGNRLQAIAALEQSCRFDKIAQELMCSVGI